MDTTFISLGYYGYNVRLIRDNIVKMFASLGILWIQCSSHEGYYGYNVRPMRDTMDTILVP